MFLTPINSLIILLGLVFTWCVLFSLFYEKSSLHLGLKLGIFVLMLSPLIAKTSYNVYAMLARQWFFMNANGEILLPYSPLKVPKSKNKDYCGQFKDSKGNPLHGFSLEDDKEYCGTFWGMYNESPVFLPYKLLGKNKAIYWASPELQIIGPKPEFLVPRNMAKKASVSSKQPNRIYIKEGTIANVVVTNQFDLPLPNGQDKKSISAGTIIRGITLKPFYATEKSSQAQLKLIMDSVSCTAISDTQVIPDYQTATAIAKIIGLNCSQNELSTIAIEAIATIPGRILYP